jgi:hypothetical protein
MEVKRLAENWNIEESNPSCSLVKWSMSGLANFNAQESRLILNDSPDGRGCVYMEKIFY